MAGKKKGGAEEAPKRKRKQTAVPPVGAGKKPTGKAEGVENAAQENMTPSAQGGEAKPRQKKAGPTKYETLRIAERLESIRGWAMHGGNKRVAKELGIAESTLYAWIGRHEALKKALQTGASDVNGELLVSAFDQARGYFREVTEIVKVRHEECDERTGKKLMVEEAKEFRYEKYFPPVPQMTQFLMTNRFREDYQKAPEPEEKDGTVIVQHETPRGDMRAEED